jgi:hypothetical protein
MLFLKFSIFPISSMMRVLLFDDSALSATGSNSSSMTVYCPTIGPDEKNKQVKKDSVTDYATHPSQEKLRFFIKRTKIFKYF